jgi:hypothetical protein
LLDPPDTAEASRSGVSISFPATAEVSSGTTKRHILPLLLVSDFLESGTAVIELVPISNTDLKLVSAGGLYATFGFDIGSGEKPSGPGCRFRMGVGMSRGRFEGRVDCEFELEEYGWSVCVCVLRHDRNQDGHV